MRAFLATAALCLQLGCKADNAPNEIVVIVDSDMRIGTDLKSIDVAIEDRSPDAGVLNSNHFELVADGTNAPVGQFTLPLSFVIAPTSQRSERDFRLVVSGRDLRGEQIVVEQQLISSFRPDFSGRLVVFLAQRCLQQLCFDNGQRSNETCNPATGLCVETPVVMPEKIDGDDRLAGYRRPYAATDGDAAQLPDGARTDDASVAEAGVQTSDGGNAAPDAGPDAGFFAPSGLRARGAASATGRAAVVYQVPVAGGDASFQLYDVYATLWEPGANQWSTPTSLSGMRPATQRDETPTPIFDAQGNLTVVWLRGYSVIARRNTPSTRSWAAEVNVYTGNPVSGLNMAVDPYGNVMLVYTLLLGDTQSARWETRTGAWNTTYGNVNAAENRGLTTPLIGSDAAGNVTAVWCNTTKCFSNYFSVLDPYWPQDTTIRDGDAAGSMIEGIRLGVRDDGAVLAMWSLFDGASAYEVGANFWAPPAPSGWRLFSPEGYGRRVGSGRLAAVAADPAGIFVALWDERIRSYDLNNDSTFSAGVAVGGGDAVSLADPNRAQLSIDSRGTRVAAWARNTAGGIDVAWSWGARPSGGGSESWANVMSLGAKLPPIENFALLNAGYPTLSIAAPGHALIVWNQALNNDATPPTAVYARWVTFGP